MYDFARQAWPDEIKFMLAQGERRRVYSLEKISTAPVEWKAITAIGVAFVVVTSLQCCYLVATRLTSSPVMVKLSTLVSGILLTFYTAWFVF